MKIAQLVSNLHNVSARANNAIYSHVGGLSDELVTRGHEVTLFASKDSVTKATLRSVEDVDVSSPEVTMRIKQHYIRLLIAKCYEVADSFDIIHSHFTLLSSFHARSTKTPTIISVHSPIDDEIKPILAEYKNLKYVSFSLAQRKLMPELNWYANVYHGVDTNTFAFNAEPKNYLLYLGRVTNDKGLHLAIEAAKKAEMPLWICGASYPAEGYWHAEIEKHIDGVNVRYLGTKGLEEKIKFLQNAKALVFPSQCEEVFGYSMIEAMSCGTPVIGWNRGSVPEIINHGKTGFVVSTVDEMVDAIKNLPTISRLDCRNRVEQFFSISKMVTGYERIYKRVLSEEKFRADKQA